MMMMMAAERNGVVSKNSDRWPTDQDEVEIVQRNGLRPDLHQFNALHVNCLAPCLMAIADTLTQIANNRVSRERRHWRSPGVALAMTSSTRSGADALYKTQTSQYAWKERKKDGRQRCWVCGDPRNLQPSPDN